MFNEKLEKQNISVILHKKHSKKIDDTIEEVRNKYAYVFWYFVYYGLKQGAVDFTTGDIFNENCPALQSLYD